MIDEIEVLRVFRDEMPGPSTDAWARARSAVAAAKLEEEPARRRRRRGPARRRRGPARLRLVSVAAVAAVVGGLLAVVLPGSPTSRAPGVHSAQRAREAAYVVSRVTHALSGPAQHSVVGYARTELPPGSIVEPAANNVHITLRPGASSPPRFGSVVSWSYHGTSRTSAFTATGQRVLNEKITTDAGRGRVTVAVIYRHGIWWRAATGPPPAPTGPPRCAGREVTIGPGGWPALIRDELGCGRYMAYGRERVDGVDAIKIIGPKGLAVLWVDPATYLPVRALLGFAQDRPQTDFRWLSPAPTALARLRMPVPAGFRQVPAPP